MESTRRSLPPLNALRTFEAAARLGSFKAAADELCVTQAAVSRQVKVLEEFLGMELFLRGHRKVELTESGAKLFRTTNNALNDIVKTSRDLQFSTSQGYLTLHTTSSFSRLWMVPRLNRLRTAYPDLHLHLISVEENPVMGDNFDAAVTLGLEEHPDYVADFLFSEEVFPVCTPEFMELHPEVGTLEGLLKLPLLDLDPEFWKAKWWSPVDWPFWLQQCGIEHDDTQVEMYFSHFPLLLDAVLQGIGVGLGWRHLVQDMLDEGRLVAPLSQTPLSQTPLSQTPLSQTYLAPNRGHYFVCRRDLANGAGMELLRRWLLQETEVFRTESSGN
ncbi:MAG: LysR substrate-binding domain-containing protein [Amphritea sp.]